MTIPLDSVLVCVTDTRIGTISPGKAPRLGSSVVAVMVLADEDVVLLRESLFCGLAFRVGESLPTTWKLGELVVVALVCTVSSLGAGLNGGLGIELVLRLAVLFCVLFRVKRRAPAFDVIWIVLDAAGLTSLTLPRFESGSKVMTRDLGDHIGSISTRSWNLTLVLRLVTGLIVVGRVKVAVTM